MNCTQELLFIQIDKVARRKEPMWKTRLQNQINDLSNDLSRLEASKDKDEKENLALV